VRPFHDNNGNVSEDFIVSSILFWSSGHRGGHCGFEWRSMLTVPAKYSLHEQDWIEWMDGPQLAGIAKPIRRTARPRPGAAGGL